MNYLFDLFRLVTAVLGSLLLLRAYLWSLAISPRDPLVRFVWTFTDWLVGPIAYLIKPRGGVEWTCLLATLMVAVVEVLVARELTGLPMTPISFAVAPFAMMLKWAIDLLVWALLIYCVLSFVAQRSPYMAILGTMVDPFLRPIRRFVPRIGGFDISPILLFLVLNLVLRWVTPASLGILFI